MNKQGGLNNTMKNAELIKALKEDAEWAHANEWETPITLGDHLDAAVNALERLTAERDAAVEDLKQHILWNGTACTYCRYCEEAESALSPCDTCEDIPDTKMPTNWEWRGPQAWKGATR